MRTYFVRSARIVAATLAVLPAAGVIAAQAPPDPPAFRTIERGNGPSPAARIEVMAWLAGHWVGEGLGGFNEEIWSEPRAGVMMGMYRHLKQDRPVFFEFLMLVEENGTVVLKLKHFNPDFSGWEEKDRFVDFPLVKVEERAVHFGGLTFERTDDNRTTIYLRLRDRQTGKVREEVFRLQRVR